MHTLKCDIKRASITILNPLTSLYVNWTMKMQVNNFSLCQKVTSVQINYGAFRTPQLLIIASHSHSSVIHYICFSNMICNILHLAAHFPSLLQLCFIALLLLAMAFTKQGFLSSIKNNICLIFKWPVDYSLQLITGLNFTQGLLEYLDYLLSLTVKKM